jgi:hypothetical protein
MRWFCRTRSRTGSRPARCSPRCPVLRTGSWWLRFHATPGTGRVSGKLVSGWKPLFHGCCRARAHRACAAVRVRDRRERAGSRDHRHGSVPLARRRPGAAKFAALLGLGPLHRARDLRRERIIKAGSASAAPDHLALTYTTAGGTTTRGAGRRFDPISHECSGKRDAAPSIIRI